MNKNSEHTLQIGAVVNDKWVILEFIAKGGMGEVYRAHQIHLKRDVAIKIISQEWLESIKDDEEEFEIGLQRFRNEVQAMAQIRHPNILQIYDYGSLLLKEADEDVSVEYIVMEFIPGGTLKSTMSEDGFHPEEDLTREWLLTYFIPVLDGVEALHKGKIIHRDMKPANVLMDGKTPKIADFGLARSTLMKPVTTSVDVKGTPPYMSPEHFFDLRRTDHRADIYSLGKILFEAIDGKMTSKTIPFKRASLPNPGTLFFEELDRIIQSATAEDKNDRLESVEEFRKRILSAIDLLDGKSISEISIKTEPSSALSHPKWIWTGIAAAIIAILGMALWHLFGEPDKPTSRLKGPPANDYKGAQPPPSVPSGVILEPAGTLPQSLVGKDGTTLRLIPEGEVVVSENTDSGVGRQVHVDAFFLDETEVTNHQYVEFLNQVRFRVRVEGDVVKGDEDVWLHLGEVAKGYEPIVFRDGKFSVKTPAFLSYPIVRVTAYGASAYAHFYGKRLPALEEWLLASKEKAESPKMSSETQKQSSGMMNMEMMHEQSHSAPSGQRPPSKPFVSVADINPNSYGVRGLTGNVNEWGLTLRKDSAQKKEEWQYVILPSGILRHPWEAFEEVGFRTAMNILRRN